MFQAGSLECHHNAGSWFSLGTRARFQVDVGFGNTKIAKKVPRHIRAVVLPSMDKKDFDGGVLHRRECPLNRHEVGPGARDKEILHRYSVAEVANGRFSITRFNKCEPGV